MSKEKRRKGDLPQTRKDMVKDKAKQVVSTIPIGVMITILAFTLREVMEFKDLASKQYAALIAATSTQAQKINNNEINIDDNKQDIALNRLDTKSLQFMLGDHKLDDARRYK